LHRSPAVDQEPDFGEVQHTRLTIGVNVELAYPVMDPESYCLLPQLILLSRLGKQAVVRHGQAAAHLGLLLRGVDPRQGDICGPRSGLSVLDSQPDCMHKPWFGQNKRHIGFRIQSLGYTVIPGQAVHAGRC